LLWALLFEQKSVALVHTIEYNNSKYTVNAYKCATLAKELYRRLEDREHGNYKYY